MHGSPFAQYAPIIAAIVTLGVLSAWIAGAIGVVTSSPQLDSIALIVIGAIFGTGAGASLVANGVGKQADAANTRLDAIHAPGATIARGIVDEYAHNGGKNPPEG